MVSTRLPVVLVGLVLGAQYAEGGYVPIYGGPTYDPASETGFLSEGHIVNGSGTVIGSATKYVNGANFGARVIRWDATAAPPVELGTLGTRTDGYADARAWALNESGVAVGSANKYIDGKLNNFRSVRWGASETAATELDNLGVTEYGTGAAAYGLNEAGIAVGYAEINIGGYYKGQTATRWDASGTGVTALSNLWTDNSGWPYSYATDINNAGVIVGSMSKYTDGTSLGQRAVRWDSSGQPTELGNIATRDDGYAYARASAVTDSGVIAGEAQKYAGSADLGPRAVRWNAAGIPTELGNLGTDADGVTSVGPSAMNEAGVIVGYAERYVNGNYVGGSDHKEVRAVRWNASSAEAIELEALGQDALGITSSFANDINSFGIVVGSAQKYVDGILVGDRAVMWDASGSVTDLNSLIDPSSGWTLLRATSISDDARWISGGGLYDPDGSGPEVAYYRGWVMEVPEPASCVLVAVGGFFVLRRRQAA